MAIADDHFGVYICCWSCGKTFDLDAEGKPIVPIQIKQGDRGPRPVPHSLELTSPGVGPWIQKERLAKGWSRARLATMLGLQENTIRRWECEEIPVSTHRMEELTELFLAGDERPWRKRGQQVKRAAI